MSRRTRFTVQSAELQAKRSEEKKRNGSADKKGASNNKKADEDDNREKHRRGRDSRRQLRKSSKSPNGDGKKSKSQKGRLDKSQLCEERERSSSLTCASCKTVSRVSNKRNRVSGRKESGDVDSIQPVRFGDLEILILPVDDKINLLVFNNGTAKALEERSASLQSTKRVSFDEAIRIVTRAVIKALWWIFYT